MKSYFHVKPVVLRAVVLGSVLLSGSAAHAQGFVYGNDSQSTAINNWGLSNMANLARLENEAKHKRGRALIRARRATTLFTPRPFPLEAYLVKWGAANDPAKRQSNTKAWKRQKALYDAEIKSRGAHPNDLAQVMAVCFVMAYEAQSSQRANASQFKSMVSGFRSSLLQDEFYQGESNFEHQLLIEQQILDATAALYYRRHLNMDGAPLNAATRAENIAEARKEGMEFIGRWWSGGFENFKATPTNFVTRK